MEVYLRNRFDLELKGISHIGIYIHTTSNLRDDRLLLNTVHCPIDILTNEELAFAYGHNGKNNFKRVTVRGLAMLAKHFEKQLWIYASLDLVTFAPSGIIVEPKEYSREELEAIKQVLKEKCSRDLPLGLESVVN